MDINQNIRNNPTLTNADLMQSVWNEALTNAHSSYFCSAIDKGADPGTAAEMADLMLLELDSTDIVVEQQDW